MPRIEFHRFDGTPGYELPPPEPPFQKLGFICWSYDSTGAIQPTLIKMAGPIRGYQMGERMRAVLPIDVNKIDLRLLALDRTWVQGLDIDMVAIGNAVVFEADPDNVQNLPIAAANLRAFEITCSSEVLVVQVDW